MTNGIHGYLAVISLIIDYNCARTKMKCVLEW